MKIRTSSARPPTVCSDDQLLPVTVLVDHAVVRLAELVEAKDDGSG
jgi:hypothetical protein